MELPTNTKLPAKEKVESPSESFISTSDSNPVSSNSNTSMVSRQVSSSESLPALTNVRALTRKKLHKFSPRKPLALTSDELQFPRRVPSSRMSDSAVYKLNKKSPRFGQAINPIRKLRQSFNGLQLTNLRVRPTVTTVLRQHHVLEKKEQFEKDKVDSLMVSNLANPEVADGRVGRKQAKKQEALEKCSEAKKLLQAKLAYERARAAQRKAIDEKHKMADDTRKEVKVWQEKLVRERAAEKERNKQKTEKVHKLNGESKRAVDLMVYSKQQKAARMKQETEKLKEEARQKQVQEELRRQAQIMQIQAAKLALKKSKDLGFLHCHGQGQGQGNPNVPPRIEEEEMRQRLKVQRLQEEARIDAQRKKIQTQKQLKCVKLIRAMKKIQNFENLAKELPTTPASSHENEEKLDAWNSELGSLLEELQNLKTENKRWRFQGQGQGQGQNQTQSQNQNPCSSLHSFSNPSANNTTKMGKLKELKIIQPSRDMMNSTSNNNNNNKQLVNYHSRTNYSQNPGRLATMTVGRHY